MTGMSGEAIEKMYKVKVMKVNTLTVRGKPRRVGRFPQGRTSDWKKAIVTLSPGQNLPDLFGSI